MYVVKDTDKCNSLREKAKENSKSFNTSLVEKEKKINYFNELPTHENIDINNLKGYDSCIVIYSREKYTIINDIYLKCLELYGVLVSKLIKANKTNVTYFEYVFGKKAFIIVQDPNNLKLFNWKIIKSLCENMKLNLQIKLTLHLFIHTKESFLMMKIKELNLHQNKNY
jgi:WbqC-like protein family